MAGRSDRGERHVYFAAQDSQESLGQGSLRLTPGEEPWRDIGAPTKYLGKIYIDRRTGERPERSMILRALKIILSQAPKKSSRVGVQFKSSPRITNPPTLVGEDVDGGSLLIQVPLLKIVSVGCSNKSFYYLTAAPHGETVTRFWLFGYTCKNRDAACTLSTKLISMCSMVRDARRQMLRESDTPQTTLGSVFEWSPQSCLSVRSSDSSADSSPSSKGSPKYDLQSEMYHSDIGKLVGDVQPEREVLMTKPIKTGWEESGADNDEHDTELVYDHSIDGSNGKFALSPKRPRKTARGSEISYVSSVSSTV